jgi:hypothetical protein
MEVEDKTYGTYFEVAIKLQTRLQLKKLISFFCPHL